MSNTTKLLQRQVQYLLSLLSTLLFFGSRKPEDDGTFVMPALIIRDLSLVVHNTYVNHVTEWLLFSRVRGRHSEELVGNRKT